MIKIVKTNKPIQTSVAQNPLKQINNHIPIVRDLLHIELPECLQAKILNPEEPREFELTVTPCKESLWYGGSYVFDFVIPENYPLEQPLFKCVSQIFHPNIDSSGKLCIKVIWNPKMSAFHLNYIFMSIMNLFLEPDCSDPLNLEAASMLSKSKEEFRIYVRKMMK